MFLDEARLASQLQHPNIPQVFDVGRFGDTYFFTMEYVHGETLRTVLQHAYEDNRDIPIVSDATSIISRSCGSSSSPSPGRSPSPSPSCCSRPNGLLSCLSSGTGQLNVG